MKDLYKILGVSKNATDAEIKAAYRKLAHQYHPNRPGGDEAKMKEVNSAYEVLSDSVKRSNYDRFGSADANGFSGFGGGNPFGGGINMEFDPSAFAGFSDLGDIFEAFFENAGVKQRRRTYRRGADIQTILEISLEEAFSGINKEIKFSTNIKCEKCNGQGHDAKGGFDSCSVCGGRGEVREAKAGFFGNFVQVKECNKCFGTGQIPKKTCEVCRGHGKNSGERKIQVEILAGIADGQIIKIKNAGEAGERGTDAGDLYVRVRVRPHSIFERRGSDLFVKKEAKIIDLLLGKKITIKSISGKEIGIEVPPGFNLQNEIRVPGEGLPNFGSIGRGSLIIRLEVKMPKKLSNKAKKVLEEEGD